MLTLLAFQLFIFVLAICVSVAMAGADPVAPAHWWNYIQSPNPQEEIAFMLMDRVFGVPGVFNSCVAERIQCFPAVTTNEAWPLAFHGGFWAMMGLYNTALFALAALVAIYHVITLVADSATSGQFLGKEASPWVAIRLVVALGLLLPSAQGPNGAQWAALYAAKYGSGFASHGWGKFVDGLRLDDGHTIAGDSYNLIAKIPAPEPNEIIQFMALAKTCQVAYREVYRSADDPDGIKIDAYVINTDSQTIGPNSYPLSEVDFMIERGAFYHLQRMAGGSGPIRIVFGELAKKHRTYAANVRPYCGEIILDHPRIRKPEKGSYADGTDLIAGMYLHFLVKIPWMMTDEGAAYVGEAFEDEELKEIGFDQNALAFVCRSTPFCPVSPAPQAKEFSSQVLAMRWFKGMAALGIQDGGWSLANPAEFNETSVYATVDLDHWRDDVKRYGWAGAATWYNKIAEYNGAFVDAVYGFPSPTRYPEVMEWILEETGKTNFIVPPRDAFDPHLSGQGTIQFENERDQVIAAALRQAYVYWHDFLTDRGDAGPLPSNVFQGTLKSVFGLDGLYDLKDNPHTHPLAGLAAEGKSMMGAGILLTVTSKMLGAGIVSGSLETVQWLSGVITGVAYILIFTGIVLFYVVPFMPFIYFFFAVGSWLKAIYEAMFGLPLWALAHMQRNGPGFVTPQAYKGYVLLFGVFLRPILTVFALVGSLILFEATAKTLNGIWPTVIGEMSPASDSALGAGDTAITKIKNWADELFFTEIYVWMVYMIALSSFKLIDILPDRILRWMGDAAQNRLDESTDAGKIMGDQFQQQGMRMYGSFDRIGGPPGQGTHLH